VSAQPDSNQTALGVSRLVGLTFGRLYVINGNRRLHGKRAVEAICSCGRRKVVRVEHLRSGQIKSCGCLRAAMLRAPKGNQYATATEMARQEFW
jgi:hypothetical protein